MKAKIIILLSVYFTNYSFCIAQTWSALPTFTANPLIGVSFISADTGFVMDDMLQKYKTCDGGASFTAISMPGADNFKFYNRYRGVGYKFTPVEYNIMVTSTTNGGATWTTIYPDTINTCMGYVMVNDSTIYLMRKVAASSVDFTYPDTCELLFSSDWGASWTTHSQVFFSPNASYGMGTNKGNLNDLYFWDDNGIQKSTNGGYTWSNSFSFPSGYLGAGASFYNDNTVRIFYDMNNYVETLNSGSVWTSHFIPVSTVFDAMIFTTPTAGYIFGGDGVSSSALYRTQDAGATWQICGSTSLGPYFIDADFPIDTIGYAIGGGGKAIKYVTTTAANLNENIKGLNSLQVYPNPTTNYIQFSVDGWNGEISRVEIIDMVGRKYFSGNYNGTVKQLDLSDFETGIYQLRVSSKDEILSTPFVKQ